MSILIRPDEPVRFNTDEHSEIGGQILLPR